MVAISLSWLPASCSKSSTKPVAKHGAPANPNDMGELMLTNGVETIVHLGSGKSCRIKPTLVDKRNVQLTMALETKQTNGKIGSMSVAQTTTTAGQHLDIKIGGTDMSLTPVVMERE